MGKRIFVATLSGVLFGFVCLWLSTGGGANKVPLPVALEIVSSRALIGVAIGISAVCLGHWMLHGLVLGLVFSIPLAISALMAPDNPKMSKVSMVVFTLVLGMVYGLLIESDHLRLFQGATAQGDRGRERDEARRVKGLSRGGVRKRARRPATARRMPMPGSNRKSQIANQKQSSPPSSRHRRLVRSP